MLTRTLIGVGTIAIALAFPSPLKAQTITYDLVHHSNFDQEWCLAPCLCPGWRQFGPMVGSFDLTYLRSDQHFDYYHIDRLHLQADVGHSVFSIVGSGSYTIGGGATLQDRMQLTASVDGEGPYHFDSGFLNVAAAFPDISVVTTAHPICKQIMLDLNASPSPENCYADCDRATGFGTLDIFDFLCFQHAFVSQRQYACDCDTSTGHSVCDVFDFLCFQNAFVAGCS